MILPIDNDEYEKRINAFETAMNAWSDNHRMKLSMSYGFVSNSERNGSNIHEMTRLADQRMYEAKAEFYRKNGMEMVWKGENIYSQKTTLTNKYIEK